MCTFGLPAFGLPPIEPTLFGLTPTLINEIGVVQNFYQPNGGWTNILELATPIGQNDQVLQKKQFSLAPLNILHDIVWLYDIFILLYYISFIV